MEREIVDSQAWERIADNLAAGAFTLMGLWGERDCIHLCVLDASHKIAVATLPVHNGIYPSIAKKHLPALRLERAIHDLFGLKAEGKPDKRPWLDHGKWPVRHPLGAAVEPSAMRSSYAFLPAEGEGVHQVPVGPIHAGTIEPGHFRFSANGETVVRLEERFGYTHKGIEKLFEGVNLTDGAKLAGRISGDSTVAYAYAFALAAEQVLGIETPLRAQYLRALMAELERIANHCGDIGGICNDASFTLLNAHFGILREEALQLSLDCFGHRLMMDRIVPGGAIADINDTARKQILDWVDGAEKRFDRLIEVYENTSSLKDRTNGTGIVKQPLAKLYGAGGYVGRASGRHFDTRKHISYPPYDRLAFDVKVLHAGDVNARLWIRHCEVKQSFSLIRQILDHLPEDGIIASVNPRAGEGLALVEGFRGDILLWLRLGKNGRIVRCHPRDPSWFQWPLLEAAIEGNIIADFPICNKSFNCSYSGHDL